nr:hypothetical protein Itr_chr01CG17120 [Ipomoea trifida]
MPPSDSTRLISSTRPGASRIIIAKSKGFFVTRLKLSSTALEGADELGAEEVPRLRGPPLPTDRRPPETAEDL